MDAEDGMRQNVEIQGSLHYNEKFLIKPDEVINYEFGGGADLLLEIQQLVGPGNS